MIAPAQSTLICIIDAISGTEISGCAIDLAFPAQPLRLHVIVDQQEVGQILCNQPRDALPPMLNLPHRNVGFAFPVPQACLDGLSHRIELRDIRRNPVRMATADGPADYLDFKQTWPLRMHSHVDGTRNGAFEGWVLRNDTGSDKLRGGCMVRVTCDGDTIGHVRASMYRGDVAKAFSSPPECGFRFVPPRAFIKPYAQAFRFFLMPENKELDESPFRTSFITDKEEVRFLELVDAVDKLYAQLTAIRRQLGSISPKPRHTIDTYDSWFRTYSAALRRRVLAASKPATAPLVSIICPVYKPGLADFRAAVRSVLDQTYANWQLVLVDDGSKDPALTEAIAAFAAAEPRITVVTRRRNGGISEATNAALAAARGTYVAFFDHDDLLVDVALDVMVTEALRTGADMLYSDEDKINDAGLYSEPAFKPDWNYRLLLSVNYVCHLLMVRKTRLDEVGKLDNALNGAQDHDLILRLSEIVPPGAIHHVPEILYHWRLTPQSTASGIGAKTYAVQAGIDAVAAHLARRGRPATVSSINDQTIYKVKWKTTRSPKVTVIIPFKDEIETTRTCLQSLLQVTAYKNFDVILIDNWSTSAEAALFTEEVKRIKNVDILRVEEEFNYSRLNNQAVATTKSEFLVFMNNDLFVTGKDWLSASIAEMQADPAVAMVGGRFYYPSGIIQHGGVVLGVGGVAAHLHVGVARDEAGYGARLLFAQEMSAVTAAGIVVRASAFDAVGGFDEVGLKVAFNDVDLCLRITTAGHKIVWLPDFVADHHESLSRGSDERPVQEARFFHEMQVMRERWADKLDHDPFYNKHFSLDRHPYYDLRDPEDVD